MDDMLVKLEEEKAIVEGKLKWKIEQFKHLEEALKKVLNSRAIWMTTVH